jgi:capsular exopolysaccharide synthesis family protein
MLGAPLAVLVGMAAFTALTPKHAAAFEIRVSYVDPHIFQGAGGGGDFKTQLLTSANEMTSRRVIEGALKREEVRRLNLAARGPNLAEVFKDQVKADFKDNNELVTVVLTDKDPVVAKTLSTAIKDSFMEDIVYAKKTATGNRVRELQKAYEEGVEGLRVRKDELKKAREKLEKSGAVDPTTWKEARQELLFYVHNYQGQLSQAELRLVEAQTALEASDAVEKARKEAPPLPPIAMDAQVEDALDADGEARALHKRVTGLQELVARFEDQGAGHYPTARTARERIARLQAELKERRRVVAKKVERAMKAPKPGEPDASPYRRAQLVQNVKALTEIRGKLVEKLNELNKQLITVPALITKHEHVVDEIAREEKLLDRLGTKLKEAELELKAASRFTVYQDAELLRPDNKKQMLAAGVSPVATMLAVCMALALLDFRLRRVRSATQVSRGLGIRVVGAVPNLPGLERRLVGPSGEPALEGHPVLESIDALRTVLIHEADTRSTRRVMVTSAVAGEGKTTLASHLATSLARAGRKVLLLDGDLRRPTVHELFEVPMQPGFSEVLLGEIEVSEACQETNQDNLFVMPAGQWDREVLQALARDGLEGMFDQLEQEFDFILLDSHPVLPASDSLVIGRQVDAVILSVRREVSQLPRVYAAAQRMSSLGIRVLGAVVNGTDPEEVFATPAAAPVAA